MSKAPSFRTIVDTIAATASLAGSSGAQSSGDRVSHLIPARELARPQLGGARLDVCHWNVMSSDERLIGAVERLLVETATGKVRYAAVVLSPHAESDDKTTKPGSVLVPIGMMRPIRHRRVVVLEDLWAVQLACAPRLPRRAITRADEDATLAVYGIATSREIPRGQMYSRPHYDERCLLADVVE